MSFFTKILKICPKNQNTAIRHIFLCSKTIAVFGWLHAKFLLKTY